ncbi:sodium/potassium-transporting ATPase subunit beta-2 [Galendromus occidentalis]|uniref:Sodium/potassium-transporting ATPase subunit beta-2 n=1 Tax=Galendromus occidentalis TaxID=34638 RepID=A0AAJ7SEX3_9ACAR|nr:sodium/potassium-transporting ATPase subunit beta-2 [Galendromus occidentalis]
MASKDNESGGLLRFLYNPDTGEVFGRTGTSWFKITVFYIVFFACLAAFWTVLLVIFYQTLDAFQPKWTLDASLIGSVPGLGFRPRPPMSNIDSTLIYFKASGASSESYKVWVDDLQKFIASYREVGRNGENLVTCSSGMPAPPGKTCIYNIDLLYKTNSNCSSQEEFGYKYGTPCVALKINKIYGWKPTPYQNNNFPPNFPDNLKSNYDGNRVYLSCEGENAADQENMGPVQFHPNPYVDDFYFPFTNVPGHMQPFVFAQFLRPERGVLINIECKAWAANIFHDRQERIGSVHFELMID